MPRPVQTRHTLPIASTTSGMSTPHGTDDAAGQLPQQTRSLSIVAPGGTMQLSPGGQTTP
jgi:hypothetical protein